MQLIDIHTHIIPEIDDGAKNDEVSLEMLRISYKSGVRSIILTSHYNEKMQYTSQAKGKHAHMKELAAEVADDLYVYPGNEIYYSRNAVELLKENKILTLAGSRYVLVEFSFGADYKKIFDGVHELIIHGYWPIVAHAERYENLCREHGGVEQLVNAGAYIQINAGSIVSGSFGVRRFVKKIINLGLVSFVASDCHNTTSRSPDLSRCAEVLIKKYGEEVAEELLFSNQSWILKNKRIPR